MEIVDALDGSDGHPSAAVVGEDLAAPGNDWIHDVTVFGDLSAIVEVREPLKRLVGSVGSSDFPEVSWLFRARALEVLAGWR